MRRTFLIVYATVFVNAVGTGIVLPILPQLILELTGESLGEAAVRGGWLLTIFGLFKFLGMPVLGNLSDAYGRRPVMLVCLGALALDFLITAVSPTYWWLVVLRAFSGVFSATLTTASAYVVDITKPEERAERFGALSAAGQLGIVVGPLLGGVLGAHDTRLPFFVAGVLVSLNFCLAYRLLPETLHNDQRRPFSLRRANVVSTIAHLKKCPKVIGLLCVMTLLSTALTVFPSVWNYYAMLRFAWSPAQLGSSLMLIAIGNVLVQTVLLGLSTRWIGDRRTIFAGILFACLGYFGFALAASGWQMYSFAVLASLGVLWGGPLTSIMTRHVPSDMQGELQGARGAVSSVTAVVGPLMMTALFEHSSQPDSRAYFPGAAFVVAGVLCVSALLLARHLLARDAPARERARSVPAQTE